MNVSRITEGEIPEKYKDAGSAIAKRLAAFDNARATQSIQPARQVQSVQQVQQIQETQRISFSEMVSQVVQSQKSGDTEKVVSSALYCSALSSEELAASESRIERLVSGWK